MIFLKLASFCLNICKVQGNLKSSSSSNFHLKSFERLIVLLSHEIEQFNDIIVIGNTNLGLLFLPKTTPDDSVKSLALKNQFQVSWNSLSKLLYWRLDFVVYAEQGKRLKGCSNSLVKSESKDVQILWWKQKMISLIYLCGGFDKQGKDFAIVESYRGKKNNFLQKI